MPKFCAYRLISYYQGKVRLVSDFVMALQSQTSGKIVLDQICSSITKLNYLDFTSATSSHFSGCFITFLYSVSNPVYYTLNLVH